MANIEIFFDDLNDEAKKRVLEGYGIDDPLESNWDIFPLFSLCPEIGEDLGFSYKGVV